METRNLIPLDPDLANALLGERLRERLDAARRELDSTVQVIREQLQQNPLTPILAKDVARRHRRGGPQPQILVTPEGELVLDLGSSPTAKGPKRGWSTQLPNLETLRARAAQLHLDTTVFGRSKRKLLNAIEQAEKAAQAPPTNRRKMMKHTPPVTVTVLNPTAGSVAARMGNPAVVDLDDLLRPPARN